MRFISTTAICLLAIAFVGCSGSEPAPSPSTKQALQAQPRWQFVDAFRALKDPDPGVRLKAVEWIGAHLSSHHSLGKEALSAAAADPAPEVASRARSLLSQIR